MFYKRRISEILNTSSKNFKFQEKVRRLSSTINNDKSDNIQQNGWCCVIAINILLPVYKDKIDNELLLLAQIATDKLKSYDTDISVSIHVDNFYIYPLKQYAPRLYEYDDDEYNSMPDQITIDVLNKQVNNNATYINTCYGNGLYCEIYFNNIDFQTCIPPRSIIFHEIDYRTEFYHKYGNKHVNDIVFKELYTYNSLVDPTSCETTIATFTSTILTNICFKEGIEKTTFQIVLWEDPRFELNEI